jgi:alpha-L-rhamnosidase
MDHPTHVTDLRCEYLDSPLGIDETRPRLSWRMQTQRRGARQSAYQVQVASSPQRLAEGTPDLWDSGRIASDQSTQVIYDGTPLTSRKACHWHVSVWDELGDPIRSDTALWTMGLLQPEDWQARWISHDSQIIARDPEAIEATQLQPGTPPLFRKVFQVPAAVRRATLYGTARGVVDLYLNGRRVSDDRLLPEWTDYHHRLHYRTFDVTGQILPGANALGAILGDGWWSGYVGWQEFRAAYGSLQNSLCLQLEVELTDGTRLVVPTDASWRCETGPLLFSDMMMGESYDARRERTGWNQPKFNDAQWLPAIEVDPPRVRIPKFGYSRNVPAETQDKLPLVAQPSEPVRIVEKISPVSVKQVAAGVYVYDLGQNFSGWVELTISGAAGTRVQLRHAERLNPDGTIYTDNLRRAQATDHYVLKGEGREVWQPRFTFHGFQYVELTGVDRPVPPDDLRGCVVMSATRRTGEFRCSHTGVNQLYSNALWSQMGNFLSVPTDCPQRDERLGWMGDAQVFLRTATYNMDVAAFFTKWMVDVADSQDVDGIFPDVAPRLDEGGSFVGLDGLGGSAGWAEAGILVPWMMWRVYGDRRILAKHWDAMDRWIQWVERHNPTGIRCNELGNNYGDWLCIPADTSFRTHSEMKTLLATAYFAEGANKLGQIARVLDRPADAERLTALASRVRQAFQDKWLLDDGRLAVDTQTAYLLALAFDLLPEAVRGRAAEHLVENIRRNDGHLTTGFLGIGHLNPVLTLAGHADVAYQLLCNEEYPSWLYPVRHGATTIWERWNGWTAEEGFFNPQMNSFNHYSLGSIGEWLYRHVAGIELDDETPGFKKLVIRPTLGGGLTHASARYDSIHGPIESRWRIEGQAVHLHVQIPANTSARVHVPGDPQQPITESGAPIGSSVEVQIAGRDGDGTVLEVGAGTYDFAAMLHRRDY